MPGSCPASASTHAVGPSGSASHRGTGAALSIPLLRTPSPWGVSARGSGEGPLRLAHSGSAGGETGPISAGCGGVGRGRGASARGGCGAGDGAAAVGTNTGSSIDAGTSGRASISVAGMSASAPNAANSGGGSAVGSTEGASGIGGWVSRVSVSSRCDGGSARIFLRAFT